jgi:hypothetical protein
MRFLEVVTYAGAVCGIILLAVCIVQIVRFRRRVNADLSLRPEWMKARFPFGSMMAFFACMMVSMGAAQWSAQIIHGDVLSALVSLPADSRVWIAGRPVTDPDRVLQALRSLRWASAHHSHPSHPILVRVLTPSHDVILSVSRDSDDPHEYWVFLPRYRVTSMNEIGRIFTTVFDGY